MQHWSFDSYNKDATQLHRAEDAWSMDTYATPAVMLTGEGEYIPPSKDTKTKELAADACGQFNTFAEFKDAVKGNKGDDSKKNGLACMMSLGMNMAAAMDSAGNAIYNAAKQEKMEAHDKNYETAVETWQEGLDEAQKNANVQQFDDLKINVDISNKLKNELIKTTENEEPIDYEDQPVKTDFVEPEGLEDSAWAQACEEFEDVDFSMFKEAVSKNSRNALACMKSLGKDMKIAMEDAVDALFTTFVQADKAKFDKEQQEIKKNMERAMKQARRTQSLEEFNKIIDRLDEDLQEEADDLEEDEKLEIIQTLNPTSDDDTSPMGNMMPPQGMMQMMGNMGMPRET